MTKDWIIRVEDGKNFINSSKDKIWGANSKDTHTINFKKISKPGDRLWFVKNNSGGKIIAVAIYSSHNMREIGPLLTLTKTDEELGWKKKDKISDTEIHYTDLYNLTDYKGLLTHIKQQSGILNYDTIGECRVDLPMEYTFITRYCKVTSDMVKRVPIKIIKKPNITTKIKKPDINLLLSIKK